MLAHVEKAVTVAGWVIAAALVLMLFVGPQLVAEDEAKPAQEEAAGASPYAGGSSGAAADGEALFTVNCGSCHTLSAAGTSGQVGPNLDEIDLDAAEIEGVVREGRGTMPAFEGQLSDDEIAAVAAFVADSP
jgi:mono/diheme cytochrome c family protein